MATPLQEAGAAVASAARYLRRNPADPNASAAYEAAIEQLATVRARVALSRPVNGATLSVESRRRILAAISNVATV